MPKVTDFGLAKHLDQQGQTQTNVIMRTPSYMAPEQAGKAKQAGPAADTYALGTILYELLTGRPPFKAATDLDTILQVVSEEPVAVRRLQPKVPRDLETICHKCLEKEPRKRSASAEALAEDLRRFQASEPVAARPVRWAGRLQMWARRRPAVAGLLALVALVVAGLGGILWAYGEAVRQRDLARAASVRADEQADTARREADTAKFQESIAQIGRADAQLQAGDHIGADQVLGRIGLEQRGWEYYYLRNRTDGTPLTLRGHTDTVYSVSYSPDGTRLASASQDKTVKVWDSRSGAELLTLRGYPQPVTSICYSPDGSRLASASFDGTVKVWDSRSGRLLTVEKALPWPAAGNRSPNGSHVAVPQGDTIRPGSYDPWAEDLQRRTALAPAWHAQDAAAAEKKGDLLAAAFHRSRLAQLLRAELAHWSKALDAGQADGRAEVLRKVQQWQRNCDLAGVRDRAAPAKLPEAERRGWEQLWADVAALLAQAQTNNGAALKLPGAAK
jgi:hypothetical protein